MTKSSNPDRQTNFETLQKRQKSKQIFQLEKKRKGIDMEENIFEDLTV